MAIPAVDVATLILYFPELTPADEAAETALEARLTAYNPVADQFVDEGVFGDQATFAKSCVLAHLLTESSPGSTTGIQSEKVGDVSITYRDAAASGSSDLFASTKYGNLFLTMRNAVLLPAKFANPQAH